MSYDDFIEELRKIGHKVPVTTKNTPQGCVESGGLMVISGKAAFVNSWHVGGITGGGYWGTEDQHAYTTGEPEPEWTDLTNVLEHFSPNITFLKYKSLMTKTHSDKYGRNDYYGNESNYSYRYIFVKDLYEFLSGHDLIERQAIDDSE